jgi:hypothetical protein
MSEYSPSEQPQIPDSWVDKGINESDALAILEKTSKELVVEVTKVFKLRNLEENHIVILQDLSDSFVLSVLNNSLDSSNFKNRLNNFLDKDKILTDILLESEDEFGNNVLQYIRSKVQGKLDEIKRREIALKISPKESVNSTHDEEVSEEKREELSSQITVKKYSLTNPRRRDRGSTKEVEKYNIKDIEAANELPSDTTYIHISGQAAATRKNLMEIANLFPNLKYITVAESFFERFWTATAAQEDIDLLKERGIVIEKQNLRYSPYYENSIRKIFEQNIAEVLHLAQIRGEEYKKVLDMDIKSVRLFDRYFFGKDNPSVNNLEDEFRVGGSNEVKRYIYSVLDYLRDPELYVNERTTTLAKILKREQSKKESSEHFLSFSVIDYENKRILPPENLLPFHFFRWQQLQSQLIMDPDFLSNINYPRLNEDETDSQSILIRNSLIIKRYFLLDEYRDYLPIGLDDLAKELELGAEQIRRFIISTFRKGGLHYFEEELDDSQNELADEGSMEGVDWLNLNVVYTMDEVYALAKDTKHIHISNHNIATGQRLLEIVESFPELKRITMPKNVYNTRILTPKGKSLLKKLSLRGTRR